MVRRWQSAPLRDEGGQVAATDPSRSLLKDRDASEDDSVWLLPCLYVRDVHRGQGLTYVLVRAAVELARQEGAPALEGWPLASSEDRQSGESFLGRQPVFERAGFRRVAQPTPQRVIMRLDFTP